MVTHTPGPWLTRTLENFGFNVVHYINGDKFDLVRVAKCFDEANARLIAAAPDLLETLAWVRKNYAGGSTAEINARIDAAIAKAEGRS